MRITIVGGGNIGTQFAVHCAAVGHDVTIFTSKPHLFRKSLKIVDSNGVTIKDGDISLATDDVKDAFGSSELIFITTPASCADRVSKDIEPFVKPDVYIGLVPGTGGMECAFQSCIKKGCIIFGLQRVPSVARLIEYGKIVCAEGYRDKLYLSALPNSYTTECCDLVSDIFKMPCEALPNYLNVTLTPSNPILHTTRLYSLFNDYFEGKFYNNIPLFYEEWDNKSSSLLLLCDDEVQCLCRALSDFDLSFVKSLKDHYESYTTQDMTNKIRSIKGFRGLKTPCINTNGKLIPDFSSRYFTSDFSYGLTIINQIADMVDIKLPNVKKVLNWYFSIVGEEKSFNYKNYNINNYSQFKNFYNF